MTLWTYMHDHSLMVCHMYDNTDLSDQPWWDVCLWWWVGHAGRTRMMVGAQAACPLHEAWCTLQDHWDWSSCLWLEHKHVDLYIILWSLNWFPIRGRVQTQLTTNAWNYCKQVSSWWNLAILYYSSPTNDPNCTTVLPMLLTVDLLAPASSNSRTVSLCPGESCTHLHINIMYYIFNLTCYCGKHQCSILQVHVKTQQ